MLLSTNSGLHSARPARPRYDMVNEAVDFIADAGFSAMDVNFCAVIRKDAVGKKAHEAILDNPSGIDALKEKMISRGLAANTAHLPFFDYTKKDNPNFDLYQRFMYRSIDACSVLGVKWTVVHTAAYACDTVAYARPLCDYANRLGVGIAIENSPRSTTDELCLAIDTLRGEGFCVGCCYDTGHANFAGLSQAETLTQIGGDRLKMLHVHDNFGDRDAHAAPLNGNINWQETMTTLARIGYTGDFNYEVSASDIPEQARRSFAAYLVELANWLMGIYNNEKIYMRYEK